MKTSSVFIPIIALFLMWFVRSDKEFKIFQFSQNQIPWIDGDFSDWDIVPESYTIGIDELKNTAHGEGKEQDPTNSEKFFYNTEVNNKIAM